MKEYTLVFTLDQKNHRILLGLKKRGFGAGKWNGFGGKVSPNESVQDAAIRELQEECGLAATKVIPVGKNEFTFADGFALRVFNFVCTEFSGEPLESDEMKPQWYDLDAIPYEKMWVDDIHWVPLVLDHKTVDGIFFFKDQETLERHDLVVTGNW